MSSSLASDIILTQRGTKLRYHVFFSSQSHYADTERGPAEMSSFLAGHIILTQRGTKLGYHVFFPSHYTDTEGEPAEISCLLS